MSRVSPQVGGKLHRVQLFSLLILVLAASLPVRAQTTDALHVAVDGKVGIGTEAPEEKFHVSGGRLLLDNGEWIAYKNGSDEIVRYGSINTFDDFLIGDPLGRTGNVVFFASGTQRIRFAASTGTSMTVGGGSHTDSTPDFNLELIDRTNKGYFGITSDSVGADGDIFIVDNNGNVGIGTTAPSVALEVDGDVEISGTLTTQGSFLPDYVFAPDYRLMPLPDLRRFIEERQHLPNVMSNKDVETSGMIDVTALQLQLLEKVEELVLYTLQQQEEIERLASLVERQAEQLSGLQEGEHEVER